MFPKVHGACLQSNSFLIGIPVFGPYALSPLPQLDGTGTVTRSRLMPAWAAWRHWNCSSYFRLEVWNRFLNSQIRLAALISFKDAEYYSTLLPASWILDLVSFAGRQ